MNRTIRRTAIMLIIVMMIAAVAGCAQTPASTTTTAATTTKGTTSTTTGSTSTSDPGNGLPIVTEPLTLTYWMPFRASNAKIMDSFAKADAWAKIIELTGITIEFIHPPIGQERDNYSLMITSNELPDIIEMNNMSQDLYPGGSDQAIEDGVYLRLNELIDEHAPNYAALLNSDPNIMKSVKTDSGNIWAFQMIELQEQPAYMGPAVRSDWLEKLDIDTPTTIDDWYNMLTAFKEEMGAKSPLLLEANGVSAHGVLVSAYDVINEFFQIDGTVKFGPVEQGFKDYVETMRKWYSEGLIDQNFVSYDGYQGTNTISKLVSGEAAALSTGFWVLQVYLAATEDPDFKMDAVPYPGREKNQVVKLRQYNEKVRADSPAVITAQCEHPVEAVKLIDFNYSPEGFLLCNYGIEGKSYTIESGKPLYPSLFNDGIPQFTDYVLNNPDFPIYNDILTIAARHSGPFVRDELNRSYYTTSEIGLRAQNEIWIGDNSYMLPKLMSITTEESVVFNSKMTDIKSYVNEMVPKFIMGVESMDNYDNFVNELNRMGVPEVIAIKQASLERYHNR